MPGEHDQLPHGDKEAAQEEEKEHKEECVKCAYKVSLHICRISCLFGHLSFYHSHVDLVDDVCCLHVAGEVQGGGGVTGGMSVVEDREKEE